MVRSRFRILWNVANPMFLFRIIVSGDYKFFGGQCKKSLQGSFSFNLLFDAISFPMDNLKEF